MIRITENNRDLLKKAEHIGFEITDEEDSCHGERYKLLEDKNEWKLVRMLMDEEEVWDFRPSKEAIICSTEQGIERGEYTAYVFKNVDLLDQWVQHPLRAMNHRYDSLIKEDYIGVYRNQERCKLVLSGTHSCMMTSEEEIRLTKSSRAGIIRAMVEMEDEGVATIFTFNSIEERDQWLHQSEEYKENESEILALAKEMTDAYNELEKSHRLINELFAQATRQMVALDNKYLSDNECLYIARDPSDDNLWAYTNMPRYDIDKEQYISNQGSACKLPYHMFPNITAGSGVYRLVLDIRGVSDAK